MEKPKNIERNGYGVDIVMCCASCLYKMLDQRTRICVAGEGSVPSSFLCKGWKMAESLKNVGIGNGKVKRKAYLEYCAEVLVEDNELAVAAAENKRSYQRTTLSEIRSSFEKKHGSIWEKM